MKIKVVPETTVWRNFWFADTLKLFCQIKIIIASFFFQKLGSGVWALGQGNPVFRNGAASPDKRMSGKHGNLIALALKADRTTSAPAGLTNPASISDLSIRDEHGGECCLVPDGNLKLGYLHVPRITPHVSFFPAEIGVLHFGTCQQGTGRVFKHNVSHFHDISPMGQLQGDSRILFHQNHREP